MFNAGWLNYEFGQNAVSEYIFVLCLVLGILVLRRFISKLISRLFYRIIRRKPEFEALRSFEILLSKPLQWLITLVVLYFAISSLDVPAAWQLTSPDRPGILMVLSRFYSIALISSFTFLGIRLVDFFSMEILQKVIDGEAVLDRQLLPFIRELLKILLIIISFFFGLGFVFELNVANIIAGLGLGGLAFALAAKESLENLFASFTIFLDKPFVVGDLVTVGGITGNVEKVGFRSTRIRTLEKSFVTLPNKQMIDSPLDNHSLRTHRRADFFLNLEYSLSIEKLNAFINGIREILRNNPNCSDESQACFYEFGESAMAIRVLFFADTTEYNDYLLIREEINLKILELAEKSGIRFAYPSRTLFAQEGSAQSL
jgi:MscS family membrane protein